MKIERLHIVRVIVQSSIIASMHEHVWKVSDVHEYAVSRAYTDVLTHVYLKDHDLLFLIIKETHTQGRGQMIVIARNGQSFWFELVDSKSSNPFYLPRYLMKLLALRLLLEFFLDISVPCTEKIWKIFLFFYLP